METEGENKESMLDPDPLPKTTTSRVVSVSEKVRRRMYAKSMRELQHIQRRSKETLDRLNFTVDLVCSNMKSITNLATVGISTQHEYTTLAQTALNNGLSAAH